MLRFFIGLFFALSLPLHSEVWTDCSTAFKGKDVALTSGGDMTLDVAEKTYHYQNSGHNWSINEHGAHALQTTIEAGNDVHLLAQDDLKTRAVKVNAGGDFEVKSDRGAVTSEAFKDYDYAYHYSHTDGGFFGGSSTTESTSYKAKDIGSDIVAQEAGTLSAEKDVHLKAGRVAAKDLTLASKSGKVKLEAGEDKDFYHHYHKSSGLITTSVDDEGHDRTTQKPVEIVAQNVVLPSPAEIDYKAGLGKEFREALGNRSDINWNAVADNYREWSEHTTTLSGPARMLVACVLTAVTNGLGSEWLASHGIAEGTATHAALSAGIQAVTVGAGTSLAGNLGDIGKTFDELTSADFIKNIASTMLTAGISQSLSTSLQLPDEPKTFTDALKTNAVHGLVRTGVDSAINGGKVGKNLAQNMTCAVVDAGAAQIAHEIGDSKHSGALNPVTHKAAHGALAVTSAKFTGRDPVSAAIGAVASETAAEAMDKPGATHEERQKIAQKARLVGNTVAFLAGRDVASADSSGRNAVENNWLPDHLVEIDGQRALMKLLPEEIAAEGQKRLDLDEQVTIEAMKNPYLNMVAFGIAAPPLAPALNHAILSTSAYFMTNPIGMKVASLVEKTAVGLGTGILAYDYGKTAVNSGFGAAFARMQEDAGLMMSVPTEAFANAAKSAFSSAPQEAKAAKTLVQDSRPIVTEGVTTTTTATAKPVLTPSTKIGETVVDTGKPWSQMTESEIITKIRELKTLSKRWEKLKIDQAMEAYFLIGRSGPYKEMKKLTKGFGGAIQAHHNFIPTQLCHKYKIPSDEAPTTIFADVMHYKTTSFGTKIFGENLRSVGAQSLNEVRHILHTEGISVPYGGLSKDITKFVEEHPEQYGKK